MTQILLRHIGKTYNESTEAVSDFNLEIEEKEFVVLVGPSGCGKSTTLRMICGLEEITTGQLIIDGRVMNQIPSKNRDMAMVFQNYALYPHMTVYDNISFNLKLKKTSKQIINEEVKLIAGMLNIEELLNRKPKELSGGEKQRVAIGRAMIRKPKIFLMDEPLSNLDTKLRVQMRGEISMLYNNTAATIIYVTHDQIEAMTLGTIIVVMKDGIIQQTGTPQNIYNNPCNVFVAGFIGSPTMNFFVVDNMIIGIRPEDIAIVQKFDEDCIKVRLVRTELLGSESIVYCEVNGKTLVLKDQIARDYNQTDLFVRVNKEKLHFFERETEKRIKYNKYSEKML